MSPSIIGATRCTVTIHKVIANSVLNNGQLTALGAVKHHTNASHGSVSLPSFNLTLKEILGYRTNP